MKINNIEFRDWVYLFFFIFTVFTLIFNTRIKAVNINKKFNFETKSKKVEKFREKFSELLTILDSIQHIVEEARGEHEIYNFSYYDRRTSQREMIEKIDNLKRRLQIHINYLCLMIEDEKLEREFIHKVNFISNYHTGGKRYVDRSYEDEYNEFKKYGKYIIKNL